MSSRTYHYRTAEELAAKSMDPAFELSVYDRDRYAVLAQVHATLATVSAGVEEHASAIAGLAAERAEAQEAEQPFRPGDPIEYITHAVGPDARNGAWVGGTFLEYLSGGGGIVYVRSLMGGPGQRILSKVTEIRRRT